MDTKMSNSHSLAWKLKPLGENLIIQNGYAFDSKKFNTKGNGFPIIRIRNLKKGDTNLFFDGRIKEDFIVDKDDLLIGMDGEFVCYRWKGKKALLNQRVCRLKSFSEELLPKFVFYGINKYLKEIEENTPYVTVKHLSSKQIKNINFPIPLKFEQEQIVKFLDTSFEKIDRAISLAKRNLDKIRQLNESVLEEVFTNIKDWEKIPLKHLTTKIGSGSTPRGGRNSYKETGIALIRSMNVYDRSFQAKGLAFIDKEQAKKLSNVSLEENDVLLNITGASVARCCVVPKNILPARVNQHVSILRTKKKILDPYFLNYQLVCPKNKNRLLMIAGGGATREAITKTMQENFEIFVPSLQEQKKIVFYLDCITEKNEKLIKHYQSQLKQLQELKNSVLDAAFKGDLRKIVNKRGIVSRNFSVEDPYFSRTRKNKSRNTADKQAMILALSIEAHANKNKSLYRTKGEKIVEIIEKHINIDFGREAKKMAAGPADFKNIVTVVEPLAQRYKWFRTVTVQRVEGEKNAHKYEKSEHFDFFMLRVVKELKPYLEEIKRIISLFTKLKNTHQAEVIATTYSAWNNLIIKNVEINNNEIVKEARENWHDAKLKIKPQEFLDSIDWLKINNLVPKGNGNLVI